MHGVTRSFALDAQYNGARLSPFGHAVVGFDASTRVKRSDYGFNWCAALEAAGVMVSDGSRISLDIEAMR